MAQMFGLARLGRDAEIRYIPSGEAVAGLSLAFTYGKKDAATGKRPTQWVDGALWGKRAEVLAEYLTKGTLVAVTLDDVHIETYKQRDGTPGTKLAGKVTALDLAGGGAERPAQPQQRQAPPPSRAVAAKPAAGSGSGFDDMDDVIPF